MPKIVDHDQRRAELVDATWQVIAADGLDAATVRRIAEVAGCTTGRVTHYFENKGEVLVSALRQVHRAAAERMLPHLERAGPDALRHVLHEALPLDQRRQLEWKVWLAFWGRAAADDDLRTEQKRRYKEWRALLAELVARVAPGRRAADRKVTGDVIAAAVDGLGIQAVLEPDALTPVRLGRAVEALVAFACDHTQP